MANHIDSFLTYIRCELTLSAHTVLAYSKDLKQWADYATGGKPDELRPDDVTLNDLRLWVASLSNSGDSPRTVRRKIQSLRAYYKYLMQRHGMTVNPAAEIQLSRAPKTLPVYIRPAETAAIMDEPVDTDDFIALRDKLYCSCSTPQACAQPNSRPCSTPTSIQPGAN